MSNLFNLFNLTDDLEKEKKEKQELEAAARKKQLEEAQKKVEAERKEKVATKPAKPAAAKVDEFKPNEETIIRFHSEHIDICQYFSTEELAEGLLVKKTDNSTERIPLTGELLRKRMEKDYPELIKDMTEVVYLKAKNMIVIVMVAKKKGTSPSKVLGRERKIPYELLEEFITLAATYAKARLEVHADIYYKEDEDVFFIDVPEQMVQEHSVEVVESAFSIASRVEDAIKVCEIHSHHHLAAYFSKQDNMSERFPGMYYVVVGRFQNYFPSISARTFIDGKHEDVRVDTLFTSPFSLNLLDGICSNILVMAQDGDFDE